MPQNWWEMYPEIQPSPAARPRPLPGPGGPLPGPAMGPRLGSPYESLGGDQAPPSAFDPSYSSGDGPFDGSQGQVTLPGFGQPLASDGAPAMDRNAAIQHAAAAIQRGADPEAVHARLIQMGHGNQEPPSPFSDLIPKGGQTPGIAGHSGLPAPAEAQASAPDQYGPDQSTGAAPSPEVFRGSLWGRSDPARAPSKLGGRVNYSQSGPLGQVFDRVNEIGRAFFTLSGGNIRGGEPKLPRTGPLPNNVVLSSPRSGGPRTPVPRRSYSVRPYHLAGGLNGYGYNPQNQDAQLLARAIYAESGITPQDMPAIGWAIANRVGFRNGSQHPSYGSTLTEVINQRLANGRHAYSFLDDGGSAAWHRSANPSNIPDPAVWARAVATANAILSGRISDPTGGAQHYFSSSEYDPLTRQHAKGDFGSMLRDSHYIPSPYQSRSTATQGGRPHRNYLFIENPVKLWAPPPARPGRR
jgi:hypothetical protein